MNAVIAALAMAIGGGSRGPRIRLLTLGDAMDRLAVGAKFEPTIDVERRAFRQIIPLLIDGARGGSIDLAAQARVAEGVGFRLEIWRVEGETFWALVEKERHGAGAYVFRVSPAQEGPEVILQAPHVPYDVGTGELAERLFFAPPPGTRPPRALFVSTVHRYWPDKTKRKDAPADVCHNPEHLFALATQLAAHALGRAEVVQLHGFAADTDGANVVVSAGRHVATPRTTALAGALRDLGWNGVRLFPDEIQRLGATTNVVKEALRHEGDVDFVHVELAKDARTQLLRDADARTSFGMAILGRSPDTASPGAIPDDDQPANDIDDD